MEVVSEVGESRYSAWQEFERLVASVVISVHTLSMGAAITMLCNRSVPGSANVLILLFGALDRELQADQRRCPVPLVVRDPPLVDLLEGHGIQVVDPFPAPRQHEHQISLAEHTEVLHDHVPAGLQRLYQFAGGPRTGAQDVEDRTPQRIREGAPGGVVIMWQLIT